LEQLTEHDLYLKLQKCIFNAEKVEFLGLMISLGKIKMDPAKLAGIADWPTPTTVKQMHFFLGFMNFYKIFINRYLDFAQPLNELTRKDQKFEWGVPQETAFIAMKEAFLEAPVPIIPNPLKSFVVELDTSKWVMGAVLKQHDMNGDWHPCGYIQDF
jgi:hypothetical protein